MSTMTDYSRPSAPAEVAPMKSGRYPKRAPMRGLDKQLAGLLFGGQGRSAAWFHDGAGWWWNVADVRVKVCGLEEGPPVAVVLPVWGVVVVPSVVKVPASVGGWLDIGPLTALELAARLGLELEVPPAKSRATSSRKPATAREVERVAVETGGRVIGPREVELPAGYGRVPPAPPPARVPPAPVPVVSSYAGVLAALSRLCEGAGPLEVAAIMAAADDLEEAMRAQRDKL